MILMKRNVIASNKQGTYELPHELPNDLTLGSQKIRKYKKRLKK